MSTFVIQVEPAVLAKCGGKLRPNIAMDLTDVTRLLKRFAVDDEVESETVHCSQTLFTMTVGLRHDLTGLALVLTVVLTLIYMRNCLLVEPPINVRMVLITMKALIQNCGGLV